MGELGLGLQLPCVIAFIIFGGGRAVFSSTNTLNQLLLGSLLWFTISFTNRVFIFRGKGVNKGMCLLFCWHGLELVGFQIHCRNGLATEGLVREAW